MQTLEELDKEKHKGRIYCGKKVFDTLKKHLGILYGRQFKHGDVTYIEHEWVDPHNMLTLDPELAKLFKEIEFTKKIEPILKVLNELEVKN